jgi:hypothetical protein
MKRASNTLYSAQKWTRTAEVLMSGDKKRIIRRIKNIILGKILARIGFWKMLWG